MYAFINHRSSCFLDTLLVALFAYARQFDDVLHTRTPFSVALVAEVKRLVFALGVFLLILPLNFLPFVGQVASFYVACRFLAFEFSSYPADRRRWGFRRKWRMLRKAYPLSLGYGLATMLLMLIPFMNVLFVSTSAVAGAFLFSLAQSPADVDGIEASGIDSGPAALD